jgi:hypothetical protein
MTDEHADLISRLRSAAAAIARDPKQTPLEEAAVALLHASNMRNNALEEAALIVDHHAKSPWTHRDSHSSGNWQLQMKFALCNRRSDFASHGLKIVA